MKTPEVESSARPGAPAIVSIVMFVVLHALALLALAVHPTWSLVALGAATYVMLMWGITAGFHRYFSHHAFKTSRVFQFVLAWVGTAAIQNGPLWWSSWHRVHHKYTDTDRDAHSPVKRGFWHAQLGWYFDGKHMNADLSNVKDLARYPELRFINRFAWLPPATTALIFFAVGGLGAVVYGFLIPALLVLHVVGLVNSACHLWGSRRYETTDASRNNPLVAVMTLGEGWHNNHHHYQLSARNGFYWWELDVTWYSLRALAALGVVWDLRTPPAHVRDARAAQRTTHEAEVPA